MSAPSPGPSRPTDPKARRTLPDEPLVHLEKVPGRVSMELANLDSLFDWETSPSFPHQSPILTDHAARYLVDTAREDRRSPELELHLAFHTPPMSADQESALRTKLRHYFANEAELVALGQRVNSTEAWGSLRYAIPVVALATLVAGLLASPTTLRVPDSVSQIASLVAVVVIWVMVWDPIEKLLFDSYFIRLRIRALHKLARAKITLLYRTGPLSPTDPDSSESSRVESIVDLIEG